jgi:hypothetical protein
MSVSKLTGLSLNMSGKHASGNAKGDKSTGSGGSKS